MQALNTMLPALTERMLFLAPLLATGLVLGEGFALLFAPLSQRYQAVLAGLQRKLNRPGRSASTRVYRGIIAMGLMLVPAAIFAWWLQQPGMPAQLMLIVFLLAHYGAAFESLSLLRAVQAARHDRLPLNWAGEAFIDRHGVLRQRILVSAQHFAVMGVGASVWFVLGGPWGMCIYLALAAMRAQFGEGGFGWAARESFQLMDWLPRTLACLLLGVAALFVPRTHPLRGSRHWQFHGFIAELLGISLGGQHGTSAESPALPWLGKGTAKVEATDLVRWLLVRLVALLLLVLGLLLPAAYPMFFMINSIFH